MTLGNFKKYFDISVAYHGPGILPDHITPMSLPPRKTQSHLTSNGVRDFPDIDPSQLINVFKDTWNFVRDNTGVVNLEEGNFASATPDGVPWQDLVFDYEPTLTTQGQVSWKNGFGNQCAEIYYRLHWYAHGTYDTDGQGYIDQLTQLVDHAHAAWSVDVNAVSHTSPPTNVGTHEVPLAAMTMNLDMWSGSSHVYSNYIVRGDATLESLGGALGNSNSDVMV